MYNVQINERGQITIPKELRNKANLHPKDSLFLQIDKQGRLIIVKKDFFTDIEDLIRRDLINQGYNIKDLADKLPERKKELANALLKMVNDTEKEIAEGSFPTLDGLEDELSNEEN